MVRADNVTATTVEMADAGGFVREPALPFFLERYAAAYRTELDEFLQAVRGEPAGSRPATTDCARWYWPMPRSGRSTAAATVYRMVFP